MADWRSVIRHSIHANPPHDLFPAHCRPRHCARPNSHYLFELVSQPYPIGVPMSEVTYEIVEHDGGWAYKSQGVFSEPYPTHAAALKAAQLAAAEHKVPGAAATIEFEDAKSK